MTTDETIWKRCSTCKKPIAFAASYYACSVSTCNRKGALFAFCSVDCWDAHVPVLRHRDAWANEATALETADAIAANAPLAVRATRRGVREILHLALSDAHRRQEEIGAPLRRTADAREAQRAFVEKRRPVWTGT